MKEDLKELSWFQVREIVLIVVAVVASVLIFKLEYNTEIYNLWVILPCKTLTKKLLPE